MASRPMSLLSTPGQPSSFVITTGASAVCATGNPAPLGARRVRFEGTADVVVWIGINVSGTLTSSNGMLIRVPTYGQEFAVVPGDLITAIQAVAAGTLNCTWLLEQ